MKDFLQSLFWYLPEIFGWTAFVGLIIFDIAGIVYIIKEL